jgi:hypothetical protein
MRLKFSPRPPLNVIERNADKRQRLLAYDRPTYENLHTGDIPWIKCCSNCLTKSFRTVRRTYS